MAGYDRWFAGYDGQGPNNASLASVALYTARGAGVPGTCSRRRAATCRVSTRA